MLVLMAWLTSQAEHGGYRFRLPEGYEHRIGLSPRGEATIVA